MMLDFKRFFQDDIAEYADTSAKERDVVNAAAHLSLVKSVNETCTTRFPEVEDILDRLTANALKANETARGN